MDELPDYVPLPEQSEFEFQLISPNSKNRIHSQFGNLNVIKQFEPEAYLFVHPLDAEDKEMKNGEKIEIYNHQGRAEVKLQYDLGLRRGNVVLTNGHQSHLGAAPNLFTKGCETDMGHGTAFHNTWINLKKINNE
ncbi:molybdopterin dinucleotide binding domain-containing protein [Marinifilum fragile]|uniref:molybdopterin dinucleotide binding domain-containing protein n=1 Tax=Marinifilum fragile TaxID=570161 RepID=UPI0009F9F5C5|nr:molybdopterin dinucleotide binding domain-containing protein [Marinifilum fragile]